MPSYCERTLTTASGGDIAATRAVLQTRNEGSRRPHETRLATLDGLRGFVVDQARHRSLPAPRQRKSRHLTAPNRAQKRGQAAASTGAAVTYV